MKLLLLSLYLANLAILSHEASVEDQLRDLQEKVNQLEGLTKKQDVEIAELKQHQQKSGRAKLILSRVILYACFH